VKKTALSLLITALLLASAPYTRAKDAPAAPPTTTGTKSVAVLSIAGYDELLADLSFLGDLSGNAGLDQQLDGMLKLFTQGQGLKGLDTTRPWGAAVQTDGMQFQPLVFLPVKNFKELLGALAPIVGEPEDQGGGVMALQAGPQKVFAKESSGWAFIGQMPESLASLPKDPGKLIAGLNKEYDVALRLNMQNVPEVYRTMAIDQLRAGIQQNAERQPDEDETTYEARKKLTESQIEQFTTAINDTNQLTLGWKIDREAKSTYFDLRMSAVEGTKTAAQLARVQESSSEFSGFIASSAAASLNCVNKIASEDAERAIAQIDAIAAGAQQQLEKDDTIKNDDTRQAAKTVLADLVDVAKATIKAGKFDSGASLVLGEKELSLAAGALIADPMKVEAALKKLVVLAKKDPKFPGVKFDAEKYKGVRFHKMVIPVPKDEDLAKIVGEKLDVAVGIGPKQVYLGIGTDSINKLKAAIDKSATGVSTKVLPFQLTVSLAQVLKFVATLNPQPMLSMMADELAQSDGKDHVIVTVKPQPVGSVTYRLTAEEGVLKLLGIAGKMAGGAGGAGGPPPGLEQ
jgi:hypothetical protein